MTLDIAPRTTIKPVHVRRWLYRIGDPDGDRTRISHIAEHFDISHAEAAELVLEALADGY